MLKNAIVVMFDSLQFNYVGAYGNDWIKTPHMDRLAREGVLFENAYVEGLPTVPCRRAMHTGRYTLPVAGWVPLSADDTTIADLCWGKPIDTAIVFDCPMYRLPKFGYTRGFDKVWFTHGHELDHYYFEDDPLLHADPMDYINDSVLESAKKQLGEVVVQASLDEIASYLKQAQHWKGPEDRYVAKTMRNAVEYLERADRNKQFFLWIDSFDPHEPWNPPSVYLNEPCPYDPDYTGKADFLPFLGDCEGMYEERDLHHIRMLYAELVTLCDTYLGKLMDAIRRLGLEQNTLLMMVSDHGEPMGFAEHGHGIMRKCRPWPYEELVHIPMIMRGPGLPAGKRVKGFVSSVDVAPTVLDWLGVGVHPKMQGKSLLALARGDVEKVRNFAIAGYHGAGWAIYTEKWSYVHWPLKDKTTMAWMDDMQKNVADSSAHVREVGGKGLNMEEMMNKDVAAGGKDALARQQEAATIDGEAQWTCTPGAAYIMPENDELYDRQKDPFQLHNVIKDYPGVAEDMLQDLRNFMEELRAS